MYQVTFVSIEIMGNELIQCLESRQKPSPTEVWSVKVYHCIDSSPSQMCLHPSFTLCACPSVSGCLIGSRLCPSQPVGALKPPPRCDEIVFLPNSPAALQVRSTCFLSKQLSYTPTRCEVAQIKRKHITWLRWCGLRCCRIQERSGSAKCLIQTTSHQRYTSPTIQPLVWRVFIYIYIYINMLCRQTDRQICRSIVSPY